MRIFAIALCMVLAACSTTGRAPPEPIIRTVEIKVPVDDPACARAAVESLGAAPAYPDTPEAIQAAPNLFERVKLLLAGRAMRKAREEALADALKACAQ